VFERLLLHGLLALFALSVFSVVSYAAFDETSLLLPKGSAGYMSFAEGPQGPAPDAARSDDCKPHSPTSSSASYASKSTADSSGPGSPIPPAATPACPATAPACRSRWHTLYESPDWWSCWIGFALLVAILVATITPFGTHDAPARYLPDEWASNPLDAFKDPRALYGFVGIVLVSWFVTPWGFVIMFRAGEMAKARKESAAQAKKKLEAEEKAARIKKEKEAAAQQQQQLIRQHGGIDSVDYFSPRMASIPAPPSSRTTDALVCTPPADNDLPAVSEHSSSPHRLQTHHPQDSQAKLCAATPVDDAILTPAVEAEAAVEPACSADPHLSVSSGSSSASSSSSGNPATVITIIDVSDAAPKKPSFNTSWSHAFGVFLPRFFAGYTLVIFLSVIAHWLASQAQLRSVGLENALLGLLFGMLISNIYPRVARAALPPWIASVKCHGETFVKIGLVLLGVDFNTLAALGLQGLVLSWICAPLVLVCMYMFGIRVLRMANRKLVMLLSAGASLFRFSFLPFFFSPPYFLFSFVCLMFIS
jgi:hypothetical protein